MFSQQLEQIFKRKLLKASFANISSSIGLDEATLQDFQNHLSSNVDKLVLSILNNQYSPTPLKRIEIPKANSSEKRKLALSSIQDKLIQRRLYEEIYEYFDATLSDKSYAYRRNKSVLKAINRVSNFINEGYNFVIKSDIDDFFDSINHEKLTKLLESHFADKRIVHLIMMFVKNGVFFKFDYEEHLKGVHQGDIISPLLSNIYLNEFDKYLQSKEYQHIRYADDFIVLFKTESEAKSALPIISQYLSTMDLKLEKSKTYITHINQGFTFLGVEFKGKNRTIQAKSIEKIIDNIHKFSQNKGGFKKFIDSLNAYLFALKNYCLKILHNDSDSYRLIKQHIIESIANKVYLSKVSKKIKTKKEFRILLAQIHLEIIFSEKIELIMEIIITKAYEKYLSHKTYKGVASKLHHQRDIYAKKFSTLTTLHITKPGIIIGTNKNTFTLKESGKVIKKIPKEYLQRIIIESKGVSLSSNVVKKCATLQIPIDFINAKGEYYAQFSTYKSAFAQMINVQAKIIGTPLHLELAREFVRAKIKNQLNYIKYLNKYHKNLQQQVNSLTEISNKVFKAESVEVLMGIEGESASIYWNAIRSIIKVTFTSRITFGAKDIVNSSLNYAYAILYGRIQYYLIQAGLALNISFLHAPNGTKPTLVFDMIEEFRTFIADRVVFSMLNKEEPIALDGDGMLTVDSKQRIAQNIKEKLGGYTMWKKQSIKCDKILQAQCYQLAEVIKGQKKKYKGFIGKY